MRDAFFFAGDKGNQINALNQLGRNHAFAIRRGGRIDIK